jgi:hypothetical protein
MKQIASLTVTVARCFTSVMARGFAEKSAARQWVWDRLSAEGVARFPFPPHGRIPNFAGAEVAAARLLEIEPWKGARAIKVNPDSPQRPLRAEALRRGITVFMPTPRLRGGFKKLDPRRIPPDKMDEAASLSQSCACSAARTRAFSLAPASPRRLKGCCARPLRRRGRPPNNSKG